MRPIMRGDPVRRNPVYGRVSAPRSEGVFERNRRERVGFLDAGRNVGIVLDRVGQDEREVADDLSPQRHHGLGVGVLAADLGEELLLELRSLAYVK